MRVDARAQSLCCVQWGAEALEVQPLSPSPDGIRKSRVQWGPRLWQWATESVGSREGGQSLATCVSRPLQTLGRGHQAEQGAVQFHLPGTWRRTVCDACGCVCVCVCVCGVCSGLLSCSHCPFLNQRPGGASVPVHVAISYLRRNYPWCVRFIWDESYKDNFFLSIKSCLGGLPEPHDEFHRDACVSSLGGSCLAGG